MKYLTSLCQNYKVVIHTIRLPKQSIAGNVLDDLKTKVEMSHPDAELRCYGIVSEKELECSFNLGPNMMIESGVFKGIIKFVAEERKPKDIKTRLSSFLWHGGSAYDAWFSCASNQVAQVLLMLPYSFSQLGMLSGIFFSILLWFVG
ncbi:unnamed protein product [Lupinus luteus]|uniref:Amino acid transporter transmembrane domain-containing protein n=1 Tax=Lupinus luteus TaxID=3873 RepID=A0AAV1YFI0_LUPLU